MGSCCDGFVPDAGGGTGGGSSPGEMGVNVENNGVAIIGNPHDTLDFEGMWAEDAGGGVATITTSVVYDDAVEADRLNIRSNRASDQSPIDNTQSQITNFGSADGVFIPGTVGATAKGATIGGGDDNEATDNYATVVGGAANAASGQNSTVSGGFLNVASGDNSHASGEGSTASGNGAHAEGAQGLASGNQSHVEGLNNDATANYAHAEGVNSLASGVSAHAEGSATIASDLAAHAEGSNTVASGQSSHVEGNNSLASGDSAHAEGDATTASGEASHASGEDAEATREAQYAHATGGFGNELGSAQYTRWLMKGITDGLAAAETVILAGGNGAQAFALAGKGYTVKIMAVVYGLVHAAPDVDQFASFEFPVFLVYDDGGAGVMKPTDPITVSPAASDDDPAAGAEEWTMTASINAGALELSFTTGTNAAACRVVATLQCVEVLPP